MKNCTKCKQGSPLSNFRSDPQKRDGLRSVCRDCDAAAARSYYYANREACIEKAKAWKTGKRSHINATNHVWRRSEVGRVSELLAAARKRAKQDEVSFTLTPADIQIPEFCPVLGQPLVMKLGKGPLSLERHTRQDYSG